MWLKGPNFLSGDDLLVMNTIITVPKTDYSTETKKKCKTDINKYFFSLFRKRAAIVYLLNTSNSYNKVIHKLALIYRLFHICRCEFADLRRGSLAITEVNDAENCPIRLMKNLEYNDEIKSLKWELRVLILVGSNVYPPFWMRMRP